MGSTLGMTLLMTQHAQGSTCSLTSDEFDRIAVGVQETLQRLSAPEPLRRELSTHFESLRSRVVLVKPVSDTRRF